MTRGRETCSIIYDILRSRIIVYIDGDTPQGRDLGREFGEARVVLALAFVGVRHVAGLLMGIVETGQRTGAWLPCRQARGGCVEDGARISKDQGVSRDLGPVWRGTLGTASSALLARREKGKERESSLDSGEAKRRCPR